jgi:hypothetical protein
LVPVALKPVLTVAVAEPRLYGGGAELTVYVPAASPPKTYRPLPSVVVVVPVLSSTVTPESAAPVAASVTVPEICVIGVSV